MTDIDECISSPCGEVCVNTEGSFYCDCSEAGYKVVANSEDCVGEEKIKISVYAIFA